MQANGKRTRYSPQGYWYWGPFGALFEYVNSQSKYEIAPSTQTQVGDNEAWQIALSYVITGENNSFKGITPRSPFRPDEGTWGAWEVALRYGEHAAAQATVAFAPGEGFGANFLRLLGEPARRADIVFLEPIDAGDAGGRRRIAELARERIVGAMAR